MTPYSEWKIGDTGYTASGAPCIKLDKNQVLAKYPGGWAGFSPEPRSGGTLDPGVKITIHLEIEEPKPTPIADWPIGAKGSGYTRGIGGAVYTDSRGQLVIIGTNELINDGHMGVRQ